MRTALLVVLLAAVAVGQDGKPEADDKTATKVPREFQPAGSEFRRISFQDAVDLALAHNLDLKSVRLDALMKRLLVDVEEAAWDALFSTEVGGGESLTPSRSQLAGAPVLDTDAADWRMSYTKPFRAGPTLGIDWRADRTFSNSEFNTINPAFDTALEISLTVPLLRGRGREANEADLRASKASAAGARYDLLDQAAALVQQVADAYWQLVYLQDRVGVLEKSVAVAKDIEATERRKARPEIGRSTVLDVTQAAAETKRREAAVIAGKNEAANQADELRRLILPFTGGKGDNVVLRAIGKPGDQVDLPKLHVLVSDALARRPDLRRIDTDLRRLQQGVVKAQDELRFQLDLKASVSWRGVSGSFDNSAGDTLSGEFPTSRASIVFVWPLGRRAAKAELRRARLDVQRERLIRDEKVNAIVIEVRKAYRAIVTATLEIEATGKEVEAASAALDGEIKRRDRGTSTILDVARLEENLTDARLRLLLSQTGLERARVELMRAAGRLLGEFGIKLGPDLEPTRS